MENRTKYKVFRNRLCEETFFDYLKNFKTELRAFNERLNLNTCYFKRLFICLSI